MVNLGELLNDLSADERREVSYVLMRYFKASPYLEPRGKDFLADIFERASEETVHQATLRAIKHIELDVGRSASEFDSETTASVLNLISDFERSLGQRRSLKTSEGASTFLSRLHSRRGAR